MAGRPFVARLKKLVVERDLEIEVMKEIAARNGERAGPTRRRGACDDPRGFAAPACTLTKVARSTLGYASRMAAKDAPALTRMGELSAQYPRYGYRSIAIFMSRDGHEKSFGRAHRLWRKAQLQLPKKRSGKRFSARRPRPNTPTGANQVWSYDFVFDAGANGQTLKCLTVTDEWM